MIVILNFNYMADVKFSQIHYNFMMMYAPENPMFTTSKEIETIKSVFCLDQLPDVYKTNMRNEIVRFYTKLMDKETLFDATGEYKGRTEKFWQYMSAMQSITTVFDYSIYKQI